MDRTVTRGQIATVIETVMMPHVKAAVKYVSPQLVVKATKRSQDSSLHKEYVLTIGRPNFAERKFIKTAMKAGEMFPIRKIQLKLKGGRRG